MIPCRREPFALPVPPLSSAGSGAADYDPIARSDRENHL